jgi:hypothetical protein
MYDPKIYWRNRSREVIADAFRMIRYIQQTNEIPDSQIFRVMMNVWGITEYGTSFAKLYLFWMVRELEKDEKSKRNAAQAEERRQRE